MKIKRHTSVQATGWLAGWLAARGGFNTDFWAPSQQRTYRQLALLPAPANGTVHSAVFTKA